MKKKLKVLLILTMSSLLLACGTNETTVVNTESTESMVDKQESEIVESTEIVQETEVTEENIFTYTELEKVMYVKSSVNVRSGPDSGFEKIGSLSQNDEVKVTGQCNETNWYRIIYNEAEAYVSDNYLSDEKVKVSSNSNNVSNTNNENTYSGNSSYTETPSVTTPVETTPAPAVGPEPAYGTIVTTGHPQDGYIWCPITTIDAYYADLGGWIRASSQSTMFAARQSQETLDYYGNLVYPLRTDIGTEGQVIEYPTFWVYLGDGTF